MRPSFPPCEALGDSVGGIKRTLDGGPFSHKRLKDEIILALESVGFVTVERKPEDPHETLIYCAHAGPIVLRSNP